MTYAIKLTNGISPFQAQFSADQSGKNQFNKNAWHSNLIFISKHV